MTSTDRPDTADFLAASHGPRSPLWRWSTFELLDELGRRYGRHGITGARADDDRDPPDEVTVGARPGVILSERQARSLLEFLADPHALRRRPGELDGWVDHLRAALGFEPRPR